MKPTSRATPASSAASRPEFDSRLNSYSKAAVAVITSEAAAEVVANVVALELPR